MMGKEISDEDCKELCKLKFELKQLVEKLDILIDRATNNYY